MQNNYDVNTLRAEWPSWVKVGVRAICTTDRWTALVGDASGVLGRGQIVTISAMGFNAGVLTVSVQEAPPTHWYHVVNFRPLVTKTLEEDMEMFSSLSSKVDLAATREVPVSTIVERIDYHGMMLDAAYAAVPPQED